MKAILLSILFFSTAFAAGMKYDKLKESCKGDSCCLASWNVIKNNKYELPIDGKCKEGEAKNQMRCISSLSWCEKKKN